MADACACRTWTLRDLGAALQACKKSAQWQLALQLLSQVNSLGQGTAILYTAAIGSCKNNWRHAVQLLCNMKSIAVEADAFCGTALLPLLHWRQAVYLQQNKATGVNIITLNAAMKTCEKTNRWQCALALHQGEFQPDAISFNTAICACEAATWCWALQLLHSAGSVNIVTFNSAMRALVTGEQWQRALSLLEIIHFRRLSMTSVTSSTAITACDRGGLWQLALALLWDDLAMGNIQVVTISSAITACERAGEWQKALQLFWELTGKVKLDIIAFNAAISASRGQWVLSMQLLWILRSRGIKDSMVTMATIATSCASGRQWHRATLLSSRSIVGQNAALSACEGTGHWQESLTFLMEMKLEAVQPSSVSWNSCASAMSEKWTVAMALLCQAQEGCLETTLPLSNAAMSACQTCAHWPQTLGVLADLPQRKLQGDLLSFSAGLQSSWRSSLEVLKMLQDASIQVDAIAYDAMLSTLEKAGQGALLLELLTDLQQLGEQSTQKALAVGGFGS